MGRKYKFHDSRELYFVSFATVNWINVFTRKIYFDIIVDSLIYCTQNKGLEVNAWCIMPSHMHLIISSENNNLSDIMRDLKRHTSKALLKSIAENPKESREECLPAGRQGCYGCLAELAKETPTTKPTNSGNKTTIL